ncbi:MAG: hypothetical protein PHQ27_10310, partial [Victivallales bacterium]|nr:hypothetical protein [Victivallales bacterium]
DYDRIEPEDSVTIARAREQLAAGGMITATVTKPDGRNFPLRLQHKLSPEDIKIILAGGRLHCQA